jgi:RNA polymerase sigma factor (sigma-70 family)
MVSDTELLSRYAAHRDEQAFAALVRRHIDCVYGAALRQTNGDVHLARDVTQSVFTDLARKAGTLNAGVVLIGWLHTGTRFAAAKLVRSERRRQAREQAAHVMNELTREDAAPVDWRRVQPVLDQVLDELTPRERDAVLLRYFERRTYADIGEQLVLTESAARSCVDRALDKLHGLLARRGVMSTATALAVAFEQQAVIAAPAGLATAVTGAALTATGTGLVATLGFFVMNKLVVSGVAALAAISIGTAIYERNEAGRQERATARMAELTEDLRAKDRVLTQKLADAEKRVQAVEDDNAKLLEAARNMAKTPTAAAATEAPKAAVTRDMVTARLQRARELARSGDAEQALKEYLWLFDEGMVRVSSFAGVRESYLLSEIKALGQSYPAALEALKSRRDEAEQRLHAGSGDFDAASTFAAINRTLDEPQRTVAFYDSLPPNSPDRRMLAMIAFDPLVASQRYSDAMIGRDYSRMVSTFEMSAQERPVPQSIADPERFRAMQRNQLVESTTTNIEVLAGAGDLDQAKELAQRLLKYDSSAQTKAVLARHLSRAGRPDLLSSSAAPSP